MYTAQTIKRQQWQQFFLSNNVYSKVWVWVYLKRSGVLQSYATNPLFLLLQPEPPHQHFVGKGDPFCYIKQPNLPIKACHGCLPHMAKCYQALHNKIIQSREIFNLLRATALCPFQRLLAMFRSSSYLSLFSCYIWFTHLKSIESIFLTHCVLLYWEGSR